VTNFVNSASEPWYISDHTLHGMLNNDCYLTVDQGLSGVAD
jgi:hypothetical protein